MLLLSFKGRCVNLDRESIVEKAFVVKGWWGFFEKMGKLKRRGSRGAA
jgi:hypothetical protein